MSDLISRQTAIDAVKAIDTSIIPFPKAREYAEIGLNAVVDMLENIPSAEPERNKGKWIPHPSYREWDVCSVCGTGCKRREYELQYGQEKVTEYVYPYCPHCGARLE